MMKLGLLGFPLTHSLSPKLYQKLLQDKLTSYQLFSYPQKEQVPSLDFFARDLDGLNITSPYKQHFAAQVLIDSDVIKKLGAVNTLAFHQGMAFGTNTDFLAIRKILRRELLHRLEKSYVIILGDGVMASVTKIILQEMPLSFCQLSRKTCDDFNHIDLRSFSDPQKFVFIINCCSRDYVFDGYVHGHETFWDYNYHFTPHQSLFQTKGINYVDGEELLELQALGAIEFWTRVKSSSSFLSS